jgi:glycosyltransferase involved in cell wall biosynthesis
MQNDTHEVPIAAAFPVDGRPAAASASGRTVLDISSIARWIGPAVGILRVEQALARYALTHRPDIVLSFYDNASGTFCTVKPRWAAHIVGWNGAIGRRHGALLNLFPSSWSVVDVLERWRLACAENGPLAHGIARAQRLLLLARRRRRRAIVPYKLAIGRPLVLGPRDVVISAGSDWTHKDIDGIAALKKQFGFRYVVICYDIIALLFPEHYPPDIVATFRRYWTGMFAVADLVLVNSRQIATDIAAYCERHGIALAACRIVPLGVDANAPIATTPLPLGLAAGRFILFVSTIEPRKGHAMLLRVWRRLLEANVPQRQNFKLVFVGRRGWQVDSIIDEINDSDAFGGTLIHFTDVSDDDLATLYHAAAFCVYPSLYEGFGLPIVEAFALGKAVIASTGGALPETVGDLSPCLDPCDEDAWFATLRTWIEHPDVRGAYETKIRTTFSWPNWNEAAAQIIAAATEAGPEA